MIAREGDCLDEPDAGGAADGGEEEVAAEIARAIARLKTVILSRDDGRTSS